MKIFFVVLMMFVSVDSWASRASHFRGWYEVLSGGPSDGQKHFMLVEVDTLGKIWDRYIEDKFPPEFEDQRDVPFLLVGFTFREILAFTPEANALITDDFLAVPGGGSDRMELKRRADGQYDMAARQNGSVSQYLMAAPTEEPMLQLARKNLLLLPKID